jgi:hypothetical protein
MRPKTAQYGPFAPGLVPPSIARPGTGFIPYPPSPSKMLPPLTPPRARAQRHQARQDQGVSHSLSPRLLSDHNQDVPPDSIWDCACGSAHPPKTTASRKPPRETRIPPTVAQQPVTWPAKAKPHARKGRVESFRQRSLGDAAPRISAPCNAWAIPAA